jgi:hypothetical protein
MLDGHVSSRGLIVGVVRSTLVDSVSRIVSPLEAPPPIIMKGIGSGAAADLVTVWTGAKTWRVKRGGLSKLTTPASASKYASSTNTPPYSIRRFVTTYLSSDFAIALIRCDMRFAALRKSLRVTDKFSKIDRDIGTNSLDGFGSSCRIELLFCV